MFSMLVPQRLKKHFFGLVQSLRGQKNIFLTSCNPSEVNQKQMFSMLAPQRLKKCFFGKCEFHKAKKNVFLTNVSSTQVKKKQIYAMVAPHRSKKSEVSLGEKHRRLIKTFYFNFRAIKPQKKQIIAFLTEINTFKFKNSTVRIIIMAKIFQSLQVIGRCKLGFIHFYVCVLHQPMNTKNRTSTAKSILQILLLPFKLQEINGNIG